MNQGERGPKLLYDPHIFVCLDDKGAEPGRGCCADRGVMELFTHMRGYAKQNGVTGIRINRSNCLDRCELGPIMVVYPEGTWYAVRTKEDAEEIVRSHIIEGRRVDRLVVRPSDCVAGDLALAEKTE
ncbi:MAG: (2Fe-2S) ferredoxin domain-containing protein [Alphaproteobacteria bacterium]|nr:(2Fe-2S) ferredoxin domain-containing protein [Pseudomonadota bacterium]TDI66008.1 MAG: (2Fe-2S) ferredoxin domain-containing protein [Alphaproteobacteria bacterium]